MKRLPGSILLFFLFRFAPVFSCLFLILPVTPAQSQSLKFIRFAEDNGLTNTLVKSVTTDKNGLIWVATDGGLFMFDGHDFSHFLDSLPSPYVKSVLCRKNGEVIVTTDLGVVSVISNVKPIVPKLLMKGSVRKVDSLLWFPKGGYEDNRQRLWFGDNRKIYCSENGKVHTFYPGEKAETNNFQRSFSFAEDGYGHLFSFAEPGYVYMYNPSTNRFDEVTLPKHLSNIEYTIAIDRQTFLLATRNGIEEFKVNQKGKCENITLVAGSPEASCLYSHGAGHYYAGTWANGLFDIKREGDHYLLFHLDDFREKNINNMTAGSDSSVWIASDNGLYLLQQNLFASPFLNYTTDYIQSIAGFTDDRVCFNAGRKIFVTTPGAESYPTGAVSLLKTVAITILQVIPTSAGTWYSDVSANIWFEGPNRKVIKSFNFSSSGRAIFYLMTDAAGDLWACQDENSSLIRILPDFTIRVYGKKEGITSRPLVTCMDKNGKIYAGGMADTAYLFAFDERNDCFTNLSQPIKFEHNIDLNINDMTFNNQGVLWLGSSFGLIRYQNNSITRIDLGPMTSNAVKAVAVDRNDNIWLGNSMGLHLYASNELLSFDDRAGMSSKIINYRCLHIDRQNRIWAGTVAGVMVSAPLVPPRRTLKPVIFNLLLDNKREIPFTSSGISFNNRSFATMKVGVSDYPFENFTVEMLLQGRDSIWQPVQRSGNIILANLEPGSYTLLVRAKKHGNYLYSNNLEWKFEVDRIWFTKRWVIVLLLISFFALFWFVIQWYTKKLIRNNENLERLIRERTRETVIQKDKIEVQNASILLKNEELEKANINLEHAKEKAEAAMEAQKKFLSIMSHELRTPLNAVIGAAHLLLRNKPRQDQFEELRILRFSAENLLALINNILDFNKIESGKVALEQIDFNMKNLMEEITSTMHFRSKEKGISLNANIDDRLPVNVVGDPLRLAQIINNLLSNAIKFTEQGSISVDLKLNSRDEKEVMIDFTVTDTGIGMSKETLDNLFESFVQGSSETTRKYGGTGLGLVITRKLLELYGSKIQVISDPGKGTQFCFSIRFPEGSESGTRVASKREAYDYTKFNGQSILLVEDNQVNKLIAFKFLADWNLNVDTAENGLIAVKKVQEGNFDIVLMDLQMPEMDGYQASVAIRSLGAEPFSSLPIIALTAAMKSDVAEMIFQSGMNDFISKPFNPIELHRIIKNYLG
ncbi:MAG: ATP-binding protein [Bacteroidetes bacterium]|nr:ATP-binding protein [Bacteroidota bacterium]